MRGCRGPPCPAACAARCATSRRRKGVLCARVTSMAGWFDLANRKLTVPPDNLAKPLRELARTDDLKVLPGSARNRLIIHDKRGICEVYAAGALREMPLSGKMS